MPVNKGKTGGQDEILMETPFSAILIEFPAFAPNLYFHCVNFFVAFFVKNIYAHYMLVLQSSQ